MHATRNWLAAVTVLHNLVREDQVEIMASDDAIRSSSRLEVTYGQCIAAI